MDEWYELKKMAFDRCTITIYRSAWACGYGYYGHGFVIRDGKYYAVFTLGSTMD